MEKVSFLKPFMSPLENTARFFMDRVPGFVAAFVLLLVGLLVARGLRAALERALTSANLDKHTGTIGINELLTRLGLGKSPTYIFGFVAYWFVLMAFVVSAANAVELPVVTQLLQRFLDFIPRLVSSILILFGGLLFARFLAEVMTNAAQANNVRGGVTLSRATYAVVVIFASLMGLEQLGIETDLLSASILIVLASAGLAFALAFGLGGRDIAADWMRSHIKK
jgi:hypothetical protein